MATNATTVFLTSGIILFGFLIFAGHTGPIVALMQSVQGAATPNRSLIQLYLKEPEVPVKTLGTLQALGKATPDSKKSTLRQVTLPKKRGRISLIGKD